MKSQKNITTRTKKKGEDNTPPSVVKGYNPFSIGYVGKPPVFKSCQELEKKIVEYFDFCYASLTKATITGLALFLGFESRQSIYDYEKHEKYSYTIKRARLAIENSYEVSGETMDIFALKNLGWKDKTEVQISESKKVSIITEHIYETPDDVD